MSSKTKQILKVFLLGILIYSCLIILFGFFYWATETTKYASCAEIPSFLNCVYFSFVSFLTIGYGDIAPIGNGKTILYFESIFSIGFTGVFTAKLAFEFLRRSQDILISDKIYLRKSKKLTFKPENYDFIIRVGNKGNAIIDCKGVVEFFRIASNVRTTSDHLTLEYRLLETTWNYKFRFYEEGTTGKLPSDNKAFLRQFFFLKDNDKQVRFSLSGTDVVTGQPVTQFKIYKLKDIEYIDSLVDVFDWKDGNRTASDWSKFQKFNPMSPETKEMFDKFIT
ncbi:MAG: two pore domain potassium channel family protein [Bacteroidetes bacterium]|nr:two pore domain potassium channel family protein [Bacteroidota bacterium]